jgi:hypothetical protein
MTVDGKRAHAQHINIALRTSLSKVLLQDHVHLGLAQRQTVAYGEAQVEPSHLGQTAHTEAVAGEAGAVEERGAVGLRVSWRT